MIVARLKLVGSQKFVLGAGFGALLVGAGFVLALLSTGWTHAAPGGPATIYACVNVFNGQTRLLYPGQPPNCAANEYPVALSSDNPGSNLTLVKRTYEHELSGGTSGGSQVACPAGARAISGGVGVRNPAGNAIQTPNLVINASEPLGEPATGWRANYDWNAALDGYSVELSVLCVA